MAAGHVKISSDARHATMWRVMIQAVLNATLISMGSEGRTPKHIQADLRIVLERAISTRTQPRSAIPAIRARTPPGPVSAATAINDSSAPDSTSDAEIRDDGNIDQFFVADSPSRVTVFYNRDIQPINRSCTGGCHEPEGTVVLQAGLDLTDSNSFAELLDANSAIYLSHLRVKEDGENRSGFSQRGSVINCYTQDGLGSVSSCY